MIEQVNKEEGEDQLVANRYNRQELIEGWNQGKIRNAYIAVIGSGPLANFTSASLVSLGFGNVEIYDNAHSSEFNDGEFLLKLADQRDSKVEALEGILSKINPLVRVRGVHTKINSSSLAQILGSPSVIIDTTNNPQSQSTVLEYAQSGKVPVIVTGVDSIRGEFYTKFPNKKQKTPVTLERYNGKQQGSIPSEVLGGIITEEARKIIMPFNKQDKPVATLTYSVASPQRFSGKNEINISDVSLKDRHVLVVGAGALGNFAGIGLALAGIGEIDILDFDTVETTNLNRQLLFYDAVGDEKSKALAKKLKTISPKLKIRSLVGKLDEDYTDYFKSKDSRPDLILDCVDSFETRAIVNYFAVKYGIPLVSGGTNPSSGQVVAYKPGESACLDCKLSVDKALGKERVAHRCIYAAQPSVIMTNEVVSGLMVTEARAILAPRNYGPHIKKMLKYDSTNPARAGLIGGDSPCDCEKPQIKQWLKDVIKNAR